MAKEDDGAVGVDVPGAVGIPESAFTEFPSDPEYIEPVETMQVPTITGSPGGDDEPAEEPEGDLEPKEEPEAEGEPKTGDEPIDEPEESERPPWDKKRQEADQRAANERKRREEAEQRLDEMQKRLAALESGAAKPKATATEAEPDEAAGLDKIDLTDEFGNEIPGAEAIKAIMASSRKRDEMTTQQVSELAEQLKTMLDTQQQRELEAQRASDEAAYATLVTRHTADRPDLRNGLVKAMNAMADELGWTVENYPDAKTLDRLMRGAMAELKAATPTAAPKRSTSPKEKRAASVASGDKSGRTVGRSIKETALELLKAGELFKR